MLNQDIAWLGALLPLAGFGSYIWDMSRGRAEPNRVSWAMWAAAPLIAFPAELAQHTRLQVALVVLALGLGPLAVLIVSLGRPECYWKLTRFDKICGGLSAAALGLWLSTRHSEVAIAFAVLADGLAAVPTIRKSWSHPRSESPWTYLASGSGAVLTLFTIRHWTFTAAAFPAYVAGVSAIIAFLVLVPRRAPLPAGHRAAAATAALRRSGLAAAISVALGAVTIAAMEVTNTPGVPVIPPVSPRLPPRQK